MDNLFDLFNLYLHENFSDNTARNYYQAVKNICQKEKISNQQLIAELNTFIGKYECEKYEKTHYTNKNALIQFKSFLEWLSRNLAPTS